METLYVTTMYRYGDREKHSYVLGVFSNKQLAQHWGELEKNYRGGKYEPDITCFVLDNPEILVSNMEDQLDNWII